MCSRAITADEATMLVKRAAGVTIYNVLIPVVKGKTPEESLLICTSSNSFRADRGGTRVIARNPLEPIPCSDNGQLEMIRSMGLGLNEDAKIWWVTLRKNFIAGTVTVDDEVLEEVDGQIMSEMHSTGWGITKMMSVELAFPCKNKATHWLVCQPQENAGSLCWNILKRDALGVWKTEKNVYFVIPAGYQNIIFDESDDMSGRMTRAEFFEENSEKFRYACQKFLDDLEKEERERKNILPELKLKAWDVATTYTNVLQGVSPQCFGGEMPPELLFDEDNEDFIYGGEPERLTVRTLERFTELLKQLQRQVNEFTTRSRRAEGFRELLRDVNKSITIEDFYGVLDQTASSCFGKTVKVELREAEAVITVMRGNSIKEQATFGYTEPRAASDFNAKLEKLGLKERERDYDDIYEKRGAKRTLHDFLFGFAKA